MCFAPVLSKVQKSPDNGTTSFSLSLWWSFSSLKNLNRILPYQTPPFCLL